MMVEEAVAVAAAAAREEGARAAAGEEVERLRRRGNSFDDDDVDLCRLSWGALSFEAGRATLVAEREEAGLVDARRTGLASERAGRGRRELVAIHARGKPKKIEKIGVCRTPPIFLASIFYREKNSFFSPEFFAPPRFFQNRTQQRSQSPFEVSRFRGL
jgi:hypothetical protein